MNNSYGWNVGLSDSENYINSCKLIVEDDSSFLNFKSDQNYNVILEHVDENLGKHYFNHILKFGKNLFDQFFEKFCENDSIGNPNLCLYHGKKISPTTLRYVKNSLDIIDLCSGIEIKKIVEVGGGYGGLCKTLSVLCEFEKYIQVDLPEAIKVQEKYLKFFPEVFSKLEFVPCNELKNIENVDLFISNYALSELNIESKIVYYENFIKNSKIVYITYNSTIDYNLFVDMLKNHGFNFKSEYQDYGYHNNIIIAAKM